MRRHSIGADKDLFNVTSTNSTCDILFNDFVALQLSDSTTLKANTDITSVTATYSILNTDQTISVNSASATTQTLPTAVGITGKEFLVKNIGVGIATVDTTSSQTVDGMASLDIHNRGYVKFKSDGANYIITNVAPIDIGILDYNDLATQSSPITITGGAGLIDITNDGAGAFTNKAFPPTGVNDIWDVDNNVFDWSDLEIGDMVDLRFDVLLTTVSTNTAIEVFLQLGTGGGVYLIPFIIEINFKTVGVYSINRWNGIYMGDTNTLNNGGKFRMKADKTCSIKVNGWYGKITKKLVQY